MKNASSFAQPHNSLEGNANIICELRDSQKRTPIKLIYHHIFNPSFELFVCDYIRRKPLLLLFLLSLSILFAPIFTRGICLRLYSSQAITITIVASYVCTVCFTVQFYRSRHRTSFLCIYDLHIQCFTRLHHASQVTDSLSLHIAL